MLRNRITVVCKYEQTGCYIIPHRHISLILHAFPVLVTKETKHAAGVIASVISLLEMGTSQKQCQVLFFLLLTYYVRLKE